MTRDETVRRPHLRLWLIAVISLGVGLVATFLSLFAHTCAMPASVSILQYDEKGILDAGIQPFCNYGLPRPFLSEDRFSNQLPPDDSAAELNVFLGPQFSEGEFSVDAAVFDVIAWGSLAALFLVSLGPYLTRRRLVRLAWFALGVSVVIAMFTVRVPSGPARFYSRIDYVAGWPVAWITFPNRLSSPTFNPFIAHLDIIGAIINVVVLWVVFTCVASRVEQRQRGGRNSAGSANASRQSARGQS
ncbi:MAG: hypothetical protein GXP34_08030 [Actinobacteria bacterium]|nr:hypothetical protein [Actinomycetota bacterium]